jgi:cell wall-associated NlpC family hydrolase
MNRVEFRKAVRRICIGVAVLTTVIGLWPVEYRITRVAFVAGIVVVWTSTVILAWKWKLGRFAVILATSIPTLLICLPGRPPDPFLLRTDYVRTLHSFDGVRYVWGGEGILGIDCSGLVRKALVWAELRYGLRTFNGVAIRNAVALRWHDSSARSLRDRDRGWTSELFRENRVADADHSRLSAGDLAVTVDGVHVMAYVGNRTWIEADPNVEKVVRVVLPTQNPWFNTPVVFMRWKWFERDTTCFNYAVTFAGWTNGIVGTFAPTFAKLSTNNAAAIQSWLDAGTNGAVFKVKNEHTTPIWIFPIARMSTGETEPLRIQIPLLNAPTGSGILVQPGQTANVQVAVLPNIARWKLILVYHEHISPGSSWFRAFLSSLSGRATRAQSMQSDWIER